jgi:hypothetical protein
VVNPIVQFVNVGMATKFCEHPFMVFKVDQLFSLKVKSHPLDAIGFPLIVWGKLFMYGTFKCNLKGEQQPIYK